MALLTVFALAVALAMDAFAVAVSAGMRLRCINISQTLRMAGAFGFFQFAMPVLGWFLGAAMHRYIADYDHWIAFALLAFVGGRMLKESWDNRGRNIEEECAACSTDPTLTDPALTDPTRGTPLLLLAIATSIDALAVGLSMAILGQEVLFPALIIGIVCAALTTAGMHLGRIMCVLAGNWGKYANVAGGLVLFGIGANILREHGVF